MSAHQPTASQPDLLRVAVIVLTWNSKRFLDGCFGALRAARTPGVDLRVLAVDNASTDDTVDVLRARYPWVEVLQNRVNLGFAGGNNVGIRAALAGGAEWVYLLNHDADVTQDFLVEALAVARTRAEVGAVQSLLLLADEPALINSAGNSIHFSGLGFCDHFREPSATATLPRDITYASGAAVLLRAATLRDVGLFDEALFLYHEDLDLGWRLRLAGWTSALAPKSVVHHHYAFSRNPAKYYLMERNRWLVLGKHLTARSLLVLTPLLAAAELGLLATAMREGWASEKARAVGHFFRPSTWRYLASERRFSQAHRRQSDAEVTDSFRGDVVFAGVTGPLLERVINPTMVNAWNLVRRALR